MLLEFNLFIFGACKWDIVPLKFQICVKRIPLANNEILNFASEEIKILHSYVTYSFCQYSSLKIHRQSDFENFNGYLHLKWILMWNWEILMKFDIWNILIVYEFQSLNSSNVQKASAYCRWIYSQLCQPIDISRLYLPTEYKKWLVNVYILTVFKWQPVIYRHLEQYSENCYTVIVFCKILLYLSSHLFSPCSLQLLMLSIFCNVWIRQGKC